MVRTLVVAAVALTACAVDDVDTSETASEIDVTQFTLPQLDAAARAEIVHRYDALDPTDIVPRGLLEDAIVYFDVNKAHIPKQHYVAVADFSRQSGADRYWLVDLTSGAVEHHKVAHGDGSDPSNSGYATLFGNTDGSHMTSLGFYLSGEIYDGTHIHSMRLDGLTGDGSPNGMANTNARPRLIVMHEADYVDDTNDTRQGRSNGCLALDPSIEVGMVDRIHDGTLIYAATMPLAAPVGRTPAMDPGSMPDMPDDPGDDGTGDASGGCSTGGGAGLLLGLALVGVRRRRR